MRSDMGETIRGLQTACRFYCRPTIQEGVVKTGAKRTFLVCATVLTTTVSAWAQVEANRVVQTPLPAPEPVRPGEPQPLFTVNDNTLGYRYWIRGTDPGAGQSPKNVVFFNHFDVWAYGTNFLAIDWLKASNGSAPPIGTPAAPCDQNGPLDPPGSSRCPGYTEFYGLLRSTFGWNQIFNTKVFSVGPLTNIEFIVGVDVNSDNTSEASAKRDVVGGLQFDFQTPYKGTLTVGVMGYKEWQHDGFASIFTSLPNPNPSGNVAFNPTWDIEMNYYQPLGDTPFTFRSTAVIHGQKGCGEPCEPAGPGPLRANEYLTLQQLVFDVGQVLWDEPRRYVIFGGYRWWKNKFGITANQPNGYFPGTVESTWTGGTAIKF
jgi:hypothetical protein